MKRGFTLIEMLVVLAIVVVLMGLIFAAMGSVREKGRQAVCINNLKQIHHAIQMYRQDYNGSDEPGRYFQMGFPPNSIVLGNGGYLGSWTDHSKPPGVWICPNHRPLQKGDWTSYIYQVCDDGHGFKLQVNPILPCSPPRGYPGGPEHFVDFPEKVRQRGDEFPLVIDMNHHVSRPRQRDEPPPPTYVIILRLNGRVHARYVPPDINSSWLY